MSARRIIDEFYAKCRELLTQDGVMLLHTIGKLGGAVKAPDPFTDKYDLPGLPSAVDEPDAAKRARRRS